MNKTFPQVSTPREFSHLASENDRQLHALLKHYYRRGKLYWRDRDLTASRQRYEEDFIQFSLPRPSNIIAKDILIDQKSQLMGRLYYHQNPITPQAALFFLHGGGFTHGSLDAYDGLCYQLASRIQCCVFTVEYRLAPEQPFPAALNDVYQAFSYLLQQATSWQIDASRIAIAGDSAGGNLAAVIGQNIHKTLGDACLPCFQLLCYPALDLSRPHPSIERYKKGFLLEKLDLLWCIKQYATLAQLEFVEISPLRGNLKKCPPAIILTAGLDPLQDDGRLYHQALLDAGVDSQLHHFPKLTHGFLAYSRLNIAQKALNLVCQIARTSFDISR